jgi:hypothetical protein
MTSFLTTHLSPTTPAPFAAPILTDALDELHLCLGASLASRWPGCLVEVEDDKDSPPGLTDFLRTVPFRIVSRRFAQLLGDLGASCEYLPLTMLYQGNEIIGEYFALNCLDVEEEAIDRGQSRIEYYDDAFHIAEGVERLTLKTADWMQKPLVFLGEIGQLAVNDELAQAISREGLLGVQLIKPAAFTSL